MKLRQFLNTGRTVVLATFCGLMIATSAVLAAQVEDSTASQTTEQSALEMRAEQVIQVINGELAPQEIFTDAFLREVSAEQVAAFFQQSTAQFGAAVSVENLGPVSNSRAALIIRMERAIGRGGMAIDPADDNRISELVFETFDPIADSPAKIEAELTALPGNISAWFGPLDGGEPLIEIRDADQMPLGSTFKLYVLATLAREIRQGERAWDDQVTLTARSFPSGMMQDWPANSPVTLQTLASMMISISDNTATDQLIDLLGRGAVMQTLIDSGHSDPELNDPFLTTREVFLLKGGSASRLSAYQQADAMGRAQILAAIEGEDVPASQIQAAFAEGPRALDVEWFANADDLANLLRFMRATADPLAFDIMAINPSMAPTTRPAWGYAGYKGGSEPGVLNLTWLLTNAAGRDHALVLSWSNPEANLNQTALEMIAQRILSLPQ